MRRQFEFEDLSYIRLILRERSVLKLAIMMVCVPPGAALYGFDLSPLDHALGNLKALPLVPSISEFILNSDA